MSLDQNLFTLVFTPNKDHLNVTDLVDPSSGTVHYHKRRVAGTEYKIEIFDPLSESLLITAIAPSASSKTKTLELYNPTSTVELKYTGTLTFKWAFKWEEHEFEWKREQCFLIRKPDPPVLVAIAKETSRQVKTTQVQLLDYNLNRFEIDDRKGLEIVMLTALMTFHDAKDADSVSPPLAESPSASPFSLSRMISTQAAVPAGGVVDPEAPPPPPPRPAPKTGLDRIAEMQTMKGEEYNEITVEEEGSVPDYAQYCSTLLSDDAMLFISVKSSAAEFVGKVLQIVEETKRIRYKAGLDEEELHQYVLYDTEKKKGPRRINLNDDADKKAKYEPPESLIVHLSKIEMQELAPKSPPKPQTTTDKGKDKEKGKKKKEDKKVETPNPEPSPNFNLPKPKPKPPVPSPAPFSSSSASSQKPQKNKLTRPPRDKSPNKPPSNLRPPAPPTNRPMSGLFNSRPSQPSQGPMAAQSSSAPSFPVPSIGGGAKGSGGSGNNSRYDTPGLSLYHSLMPHTPGPPPSMPGGFQQLPPPPSPAEQHPANSTPPSKPLTASGVAQTVVSGLFDMVKNHRR